MYRFRHYLAGTCFVSALAFAPLTANAADLYRSPAPAPSYVPPAAYVEFSSWAGFYGGINGGYGWNDDGNMIAYSDGPTSSRAHPQGGFGGGQAGYNFQRSSVVFGLESDFQGGYLGASSSHFSSKEDVDWFGTVRGRLGYSFGRTLVYGTGGFAYGDVRQTAFDGGTTLSNNATQMGWVAGGGVEYKISRGWSLKGEYQYIDFGDEKLKNAGNSVSTNSLATTFQTVRLGLNYHFGGPVESLK